MMLLGGISPGGSEGVVAGVDPVENAVLPRHHADSAGGTVWTPARSGCASGVDEPRRPSPALHRPDRSCPDSSPDPPPSCPHSCLQGTSTPVETREIMRFSAVETCGYMWATE